MHPVDQSALSPSRRHHSSSPEVAGELPAAPSAPARPQHLPRRPVVPGSRRLPAMKRACMIHDAVNLVLLPFITALTVAGLGGWIPPEIVTSVFLGYVGIDLLWVAIQVRRRYCRGSEVGMLRKKQH